MDHQAQNKKPEGIRYHSRSERFSPHGMQQQDPGRERDEIQGPQQVDERKVSYRVHAPRECPDQENEMLLGRLRVGQLISHKGMGEIPDGKREDHRCKNSENRQVQFSKDNEIRELVFEKLTENE